MSATIHIQIRTTVVGVVMLWLAALGLLTWDLADGPRVDEMGRLGLFVTAAAATGTVVLIMLHCRRVILEVISYEHKMLVPGPRGEQESDNIRAIH